MGGQLNRFSDPLKVIDWQFSDREAQMSAYVVYTMIELKDPELFAEYRKAVATTIQAHGGRRMAAAGKFEVLEGEWPGKVVTLLEFDDKEAIERWYLSDEVKRVMAMRQKAAIGNLIVVDGA